MKDTYKYKVIIIGLGKIGFKYDLNSPNDFVQSHAKTFLKNPNFDLIAGIDISEKNCNIFFNKNIESKHI